MDSMLLENRARRYFTKSPIIVAGFTTSKQMRVSAHLKDVVPFSSLRSIESLDFSSYLIIEPNIKI